MYSSYHDLQLHDVASELHIAQDSDVALPLEKGALPFAWQFLRRHLRESFRVLAAISS